MILSLILWCLGIFMGLWILGGLIRWMDELSFSNPNDYVPGPSMSEPTVYTKKDIEEGFRFNSFL